jgi:hypothetical protein
MGLRCLAAILAFLAAFASDSPGQSKQQTPRPTQSAQPNQTSKLDERGTDQSPFIVKVLPTKESEEKAAADARREDGKTANDARLARFTELLFWATGALCIIALFQLFVFGWQGIQLRRTVRASENEFIATHRPKIRVKHFWLTSDIWDGTVITANVTYVNNGTANALFNDTGIRFVVVRKDRLIPFDPHIPAIHFNPPNREITCGRSWEFQGMKDGTMLTPEQNVEIQEQKSRLYCIGYVSYLDAAGRMRITGFCRVLRFPLSSALAYHGNVRFRRFPDPDYEYED